MGYSQPERDSEHIYNRAEAAAGVSFADSFPELRGGDVPQEFSEEFEAALREYIGLSLAGRVGVGPWSNDTATRLAVYPELRERFDAAVRHALDQAYREVAVQLALPEPPAPTPRLIKAARDLWSAYLAFTRDPQLPH